MRNNINITGNNQSFPYIIEYNTINTYTNNKDVKYSKATDTIYLFNSDIEYYRKKNDWYNKHELQFDNEYIPFDIKLANIKLYIPAHSINAYFKNIKYILTANTWINGVKIDLGSFVFKSNDTVANDDGSLKNGNNEYHEYVEFNIMDPFDIVYADDWADFRSNICGEPVGLNNAGSLLQVTLYAVDEFDNHYIMNADCTGGMTAFNISNEDDIMSLILSSSLDPFGFKCNININKVYDWFLTYLLETYNLNVTWHDISFELVIKNKNSIIPGPRLQYDVPNAPAETYGNITKIIPWSFIKANKHKDDFKLIYEFFNSWDNFDEGWNIVASLIISKNNEDILTLISNELPITQELFKFFVNDGTHKLIDISDMEIKTYNVINKITNNIVQIERPNDSKSNIIQPVFFKVKDTEVLTLHPAVTENICINLDDYKSKVERFTLQIGNSKFEQIGANKYGILFKITGNTLSNDTSSGTYYILNENLELVTSGKYNYAI